MHHDAQLSMIQFLWGHILSFFFFMVPKIESRGWSVVGEHSTTELHPSIFGLL